jgi:antitoxin component YwqK of YwqJK toxin-antitoxin module
MRTLNYILVVAVLLAVSCSQIEKKSDSVQNVQVSDVQKQSYSGQVVEYYQNGNKKYEIKYVEGKPNGKYLTWFSDGSKKAEGEYKEGKRIGLWKWFSEKGNVNFTVVYNETEMANL